MRGHYMTLCFKGNTEVTYMLKDTGLEVTFEQAVIGGFNTLVLDDSGNILSNTGFNASDIEFFQEFLKNNLSIIYADARNEL